MHPWYKICITKSTYAFLRLYVPFWGNICISLAKFALVEARSKFAEAMIELLRLGLHCWGYTCIIELLRLDLHCCDQIDIAEARYELLRQALVCWGQFFVANVGYQGHPWGQSAFSENKSTFAEAKIALIRPDLHFWVHICCLSQIFITLRQDLHC